MSTDSSASEPASWFDLLGWKEGDIEGVRSLGYAYLEQGCYERARLLFEGLTGLDRAEVADLQILGAISLELNKPEQAVEWLGQALALDPHHLPSLLNRAKALFALGAKDRAIPIAQRLLQAEDLAIAKVAEALLMGHAPESLPFDSSSV